MKKYYFLVFLVLLVGFGFGAGVILTQSQLNDYSDEDLARELVYERIIVSSDSGNLDVYADLKQLVKLNEKEFEIKTIKVLIASFTPEELDHCLLENSKDNCLSQTVKTTVMLAREKKKEGLSYAISQRALKSVIDVNEFSKELTVKSFND